MHRKGKENRIVGGRPGCCECWQGSVRYRATGEYRERWVALKSIEQKDHQGQQPFTRVRRLKDQVCQVDQGLNSEDSWAKGLDRQANEEHRFPWEKVRRNWWTFEERSWAQSWRESWVFSIERTTWIKNQTWPRWAHSNAQDQLDDESAISTCSSRSQDRHGRKHQYLWDLTKRQADSSGHFEWWDRPPQGDQRTHSARTRTISYSMWWTVQISRASEWSKWKIREERAVA